MPDGTLRTARYGGRTVLDVEGITYNVDSIETLDGNLATCIRSHCDALLDARISLYGQSRACTLATCTGTENR